MVKKILLVAILFIFGRIAFAGDLNESAVIESEVTAIQNFNVESYMGKWYEIVRLPTYFAKHCQAPITAEFERKGDEIEVTNECAIVSGSKDISNSIIYLNPENFAGDGRLTGTSMPGWLRWTYLGRHDYWILYNDPKYALVVTPDRKYLWLFARMESPPLKDVQRILGIAKKQGFDMSNLIFDYPSYFME